MVLRLSELLERIRPAGAPGAAAVGEAPADTAAEAELADLLDALATIEAEVDEILARARERAEGLGHDAQRRAVRIRAHLPERIAVARAEVERSDSRVGARESARIVDDAHREADRRVSIARSHLDDIVTAALDEIWQLVPPVAPDGGRRP